MVCKILFFSLLTLASVEGTLRNVVYIYAGSGASKKSLSQMAYTLEPLLPTYKIKKITAEELINTPWEEETALFILPGGSEAPYVKALNGSGNKKIRSYVENGGSFLAFCAGSYYSGNYIDFSNGGSIEIHGARELGFFPGTVRGSLLAPYDFESRSGARAAKIIWEDEGPFDKGTIFTLYYNGGGYFVDAGKAPNTTILGTYDVPEEYAAIVECSVGKGKALLSAVHFEWAPELLDGTEAYLQPIIPVLQSTDSLRTELFTHILERMDLITVSPSS